jgi:holo-[acyl-carrier protein] synthase
MIFGTGIDMIEVERVARSVGRDSGFRELVFSQKEMAYCESKAAPFEHYAARFAAKEAFLKALGSGWTEGLSWNEIEILPEENGKPVLRVCGQTAKTLEGLQIRRIHVSLSHVKNMASAVVILET